MIKKYCETHHLYYESELCPFCQKDKYEKMSHGHSNIRHEVNKDKKIQITDDVISKLKAHFNGQGE